jgi:serine/threonine protein phosphatase 1
MNRKDSIELILGNHELFALRVLPFVNSPVDEITEDFYAPDVKKRYRNWTIFNGGESTFNEFYPLSIAKQKEILSFLDTLPTSIEVSVNGNNYFLVHAGIDDYTTDEELGLKTTESFVWHSPENFDTPFFKEENRFLVFGHTPTFLLQGGSAGKIFRKNNYIGIDCGAVFEYAGGKLGCLCLNTMEEFYV